MLRSRELARQVLAMFLVLFMASHAAAHEVRPAVAEVDFPEGEARYQITFVMNVEALLAGIGPEHDDTDDAPTAGLYDSLRAMPPAALRAAFDEFAPKFLSGLDVKLDGAATTPSVTSLITPEVGDLDLPRDSILTVSGETPAGAEALTFAWSAGFGPVVFRTVVDENGDGYSVFLRAGDVSDPIPVAGGAKLTAMEAFVDYLWVGFEHILPLGLDHILFVIGLFLLSTQLRPLLIQVTSFTAAHTVTLALGALGVITLPGSVVEPLIALSITYVALENVWSEKLQKWRPVVVFCFGLLHGLGFAGVLSEFGFAPGQFVASLIAFNIGVEIGQLVVIAICFLAVGAWFGKRDWYRPAIVFPASIAIGGYSFAWFIERSLEIELPIVAVLGFSVALGAAILFAKDWRRRPGPLAGVLVAAAALTYVLSILESMIP